jgi:hypothetical protein
MAELAFFLAFQILVNLLAGYFLPARGQYIFKSTAYLLVLLMLAYPFLLINFYYNNFYGEDDIKCGNVYIGMVLFLWVIGAPAVLLTQFLLNRSLFRRSFSSENN